MSDEERFEAGQVLYLERLLNGKWFRKGHIRLEDYISEQQEEARQYREQWLRAVEQERQKVRAEFEEWKKNHLNHEADDLRAEVEQLRRDWAATQNALNQAAYERDEARATVAALEEGIAAQDEVLTNRYNAQLKRAQEALQLLKEVSQYVTPMQDKHAPILNRIYALLEKK